MLSQSHSFLLSSLGFLILRGISAQYNSQAKPEDPIRSGLFNAQVKFRAEPRHVSTQRPVSSSSLLCCQDFDREIEPRISCTCRYLYEVFLNWISECRFWRAAMGSAFPTSHSSDHLERWRKYLSNWKCKEILKELDWGVQLQGFEGSVEASGEGVLRNWASQRLYWALDPVDRYTAGFVMAVPYGCDGNGRCNIGNWFKGKKTKKKHHPSCVSAVVKTQLFLAFWTGCIFAPPDSLQLLVALLALLANSQTQSYCLSSLYELLLGWKINTTPVRSSTTRGKQNIQRINVIRNHWTHLINGLLYCNIEKKKKTSITNIVIIYVLYAIYLYLI